MAESHDQAFQFVLQREFNRPDNRRLRDTGRWPRLRWDTVRERLRASFEGKSCGPPANVVELFAQRNNRALSQRYKLYKEKRGQSGSKVHHRWTLANERSLVNVINKHQSSVVVRRKGKTQIRWVLVKGLMPGDSKHTPEALRFKWWQLNKSGPLLVVEVAKTVEQPPDFPCLGCRETLARDPQVAAQCDKCQQCLVSIG